MFVPMKWTGTILYENLGFHTTVFNANNLALPTSATPLHQPMYFDQYKALYQRWLVYDVSIRMEIANSGITPVEVAVLPSALSSPYTTVIKAIEQPYAKSVMLANLGQNRAVLRHRMSTKKIRGEQLMDDAFAGTGDIGPARNWFWTIVVEGVPDTTATNCAIKFVLMYKVRWFKRLSQEIS